jgi:hypothetical protein
VPSLPTMRALSTPLASYTLPQVLPNGTMSSRQELEAAADAFCVAHVAHGRFVPPAGGYGGAEQQAAGAADGPISPIDLKPQGPGSNSSGGGDGGSRSGISCCSGSSGSTSDLVCMPQHASSGLLGAAASSSLGHSSSSTISTTSSAAPRGAASAAREAAGTWLRQVWALARRERAAMLRNPTDVAGRALVFCWLGLLVGLVFYDLGYEVTAFRTRANLLLVQLLVPLLLPFCYISWHTADKRVRLLLSGGARRPLLLPRYAGAHHCRRRGCLCLLPPEVGLPADGPRACCCARPGVHHRAGGARLPPLRLLGRQVAGHAALCGGQRRLLLALRVRHGRPERQPCGAGGQRRLLHPHPPHLQPGGVMIAWLSSCNSRRLAGRLQPPAAQQGRSGAD